MIRLDSQLRKIQAVLAGAVTTNQLPVTVSYSDLTTSAYTGGTTVINTNSTTAVDICAAPAASTVRDIDYLSVRNSDTVPATITIRYNDNATLYTLFTATLAVGDILIYVHGSGVHVLDSSGSVKSTVTFAGLVVASGKTLTVSKSMTLTAADDTGVYTFPTGTKTLLAADGTGASLTAVNAVTLLTKTWAAPDAIGSGTPAAGAFTTGTFSGNVGVGTVTPGAGITGNILHVWGNSAATLPRIIVTNDRDANSNGIVRFDKSRNGGVLVSGDFLGQVDFVGHDGTSLVSAAYIAAVTEGVIATNQISASLQFATKNLTASRVERLRITPIGDLAMAAANKLYFDGVVATGDTHIAESSANVLDLTAGGSTALRLTATAATATGILSTTDATDATSATAASLKTAGGIAAVKGLWVGTTSRLVGNVQMDGTATVTGAFGCNTKAAQAAYASGGALAAYGAGLNGFDTGANASALHAMVVSIRAALVANGVMS